MYTADRNLECYLVKRLTDAQIAFTPSELGYRFQRNVDKRAERRFQVNEAALLFLFNSLRTQEMLVRLFDVSRRGLGVSASEALERGTDVQVHLKDMLVVGKVRYCVPVGDSFHSGVLIESVLRRM